MPFSFCETYYTLFIGANGTELLAPDQLFTPVFVRGKCVITMVEDVQAMHIKAFLIKMQRAGEKANCVDDLLKAFKVMFRYAYEQ